MNIAHTNNFVPASNPRNCGRRLALSGAFVLFLGLNAFSLRAGDLFFPAPQPAKNAPPGGPAFVSPSAANNVQATNVTQAAVTNSMDALDDKHTLAIGDILSFRIVEDEEDSKTLIVTDSGDLEVPYLGRFPAENKTCRQLARELKTALEKEYYYQATVIIAVDSMARSRGKVYLVGAVHMPGPQELPSDEVLTLSKAVLRAGGFTDFAEPHHVKITRQGSGGDSDKVTLVVDVGQIFDEGKTEKDVPLKADDLIYIPERLINF
jgi:protein involved in polysaccharide export with SLBB domain